MPVVAPTLTDLTAATLDGSGVFDVLMKANKAHLEEQFDKGRIKGAEYASVYLGSLEQVLQQAVVFLLAKDKSALEAQLIEAQITLAEKQALLADKELLIKDKELLIKDAELAIKQAELPKITAEVALLEQQKLNLIAEALNIPKQGVLIDAQKDKVVQEKTNLIEQRLLLIEQTESEAFRNFVHPSDPTLSGTLEKERQVLIGQKCKLDAEFDLLAESKLKAAQETQLLTWKVTTEKAQTSSLGVDPDSVIGKQKLLYTAQADGFARDAEQKATKIMVDSWSVRRTTDEGTVVDGTNMLNDTAVGRAVTKLLTGVGA